MKEKTLSRIVIIILAIVLAATGALAAFIFISNQKLEKELRSIRREIDNIDTGGDGVTAAQLALISETMMGQLEGTIQDVTADISTQITSEIAKEISGVEDTFSKYDEDIQSIVSSLEELNESMMKVNEVIADLQEILDSIKSFLRIE